MDSLLAGLLVCLALIALVGGHSLAGGGDALAEQYWKSALPNTPMPASLSHLLDTPAAAAAAAGAGGNVKPSNVIDNGVVPLKRSSNVQDAGIGPLNSAINWRKAATERQLQDAGVRPSAINWRKAATEKQLQDAGVRPSAINWRKAATEKQLRQSAAVALYFLEEDIQPGKKLTLHFMPTTPGEKFLPRVEADAIPFSSDKIPQILSRFSVSPESAEAAEITETLHDCEEPAAKGEKKACATSLESMVDFATSSIGTSRVRAVSTIVRKEDSPKQNYTVTTVKRESVAVSVVCHAEPYAYAVFLCHMTPATRAYMVSVVGEDGTTAEAVAVCHTDTTGWNPMHLAFQMLKVKPGTVPVCHFLPQNDVVWTRSG